MTLPISIGQKFGSLTVEEIRSRGKSLCRAAYCRCDCGNPYTTDVRRLVQGFTSRCSQCASTKLEMLEGALRRAERQYRTNARHKNLKFDLSQEQFRTLVQSPCAYCGLSPAKGIDREENLIGYIPGNCAACCADCNRAKSNMPPPHFKAWILRLSLHQGFSL